MGSASVNGCVCVSMKGVAILYKADGKGLTENMTLAQRLEGSMKIPRDELFQVEVPAHVNKRKNLFGKFKKQLFFKMLMVGLHLETDILATLAQLELCLGLGGSVRGGWSNGYKLEDQAMLNMLKLELICLEFLKHELLIYLKYHL